MTATEHNMMQDTLMLCAGMLQQFDWQKFIGAIDRADTMGPILDPTLYRSGSQRMQAIRRVAVAAQELVAAKAALDTEVQR